VSTILACRVDGDAVPILMFVSFCMVEMKTRTLFFAPFSFFGGKRNHVIITSSSHHYSHIPLAQHHHESCAANDRSLDCRRNVGFS